MNEQFHLSEAEYALVIELLEREYRDLPGELHHTDKSSYREELRNRKEVVRSLLDRLKEELVAVKASVA